MAAAAKPYHQTRFVLQRAVAFIYFIGFLIVINQYLPLLGSRGLLPVANFLKRISFWDSPSLFFMNASDTALIAAGWVGLCLSLIALSGISERFGIWISSAVWFLLWLLYLSIVNAGQVFYGFGWETLLLETGFLMIFMGDSKSASPAVLFWLVRWILFRLMFGAGLIKLRGDECWHDLTCMSYHYETQPLPNPLSWHFHSLSPWIHKAEVLLTHFVELVVPFGLFFPGRIGATAAGMMIIFQIILILSGNLSWLNYITIVLCLACFTFSSSLQKLSSSFPHEVRRESASKDPRLKARSRLMRGALFGKNWTFFSENVCGDDEQRIALPRKIVLGILMAFIFILSIQPAINLFSPHQMMNASFEPLHLVNTYGAFGSITRQRDEIILEGTGDSAIGPETQWKAYEFKCKPGDLKRAPCVVSPYHYKLDWQMWFAAMSSYQWHPWILHLAAKLLSGEKETLRLIGYNPFESEPPKFIRARLYRYRFAGAEERMKGVWWTRTLIREYFPPVSLDNPSFLDLLSQMGW